MDSENTPETAFESSAHGAQREYDVTIVGGLGHVGLPLGLAFADAGYRVCLQDVNRTVAEQVLRGEMPFVEYGAEEILERVLDDGSLSVSLSPETAGKATFVVVALGTPVDEYLNPKTRVFLQIMQSLAEHLDDEQTIVVRSTVFPGTCQQLSKALASDSGPRHIAYCPERIVQGHAVRELGNLPQIVSGLTDEAVERTTELFGNICPKIVHASVEEAELAKLFCNAWRYVQFAVANQFYMISHQFETDFNRVREVMRDGYGRASALPGAGFAAGPCLVKDTMQLAAFHNNRFFLGHAAMLVNEGMPNFVVEELSKRHDLSEKSVGILGMAFKADVDDTRDSLSYKLGKILRFRNANVLYSDEFASDPTFVDKETLVAESEIVIIGVPHSAYANLDIPDHVEVVDLWGITRKAAPQYDLVPKAA